MKDYIVIDPWKIIEDQYRPEYNKISESLMSIGNGKMGQRACFEESYSGETMSGSYIGGVYYPDKTKVGWWKNGYPEYFAKVLNSVDWINIKVMLDDEEVDVAKSDVKSFYRELDMKTGILSRRVHLITTQGKEIKISSERFCSMDDTRLGVIKYSLESTNFRGKIKLRSGLNFDVRNEDSNYDEKFWTPVKAVATEDHIYVQSVTKKTGFHAGAVAEHHIDHQTEVFCSFSKTEDKAFAHFEADIQEGQELTIYKYTAISSSLDYADTLLQEELVKVCQDNQKLGYHNLHQNHTSAWAKKWDLADIQIHGDDSAQQGIRFNIFHLLQTYTGEDNRLNIGPKGFTGEKYGGSTYWDTEAYCLPFYLGTAGQEVARNLLIYRHNQLDKAIENAEKLGFNNGAALYPMVTMNGEECHNEWEITFEEIHRNGAIAYAIYDYINYTGDQQYLADYGLDVLVGIARFWCQRVNWSEDKQQYVMLGVTGPNEYENNVNNNWYTNYIAKWCMEYTMEALKYVEENHASRYQEIISALKYSDQEAQDWTKRCSNMYLPESEKHGVFLQQDGFLDKELIPVDQLAEEHRPLNQKWSWDRILRSCYIKQADVLQGIYFFEDDFDRDTIERNFSFYEPLTVHESSLSPCVHSILACKIDHHDKAYEMYLRTARLDLNDYNNDTEDGLHITSMAGTWLSIIRGFAGLRVQDGQLYMSPHLPTDWESVSFKIKFRGSLLKVQIEGTKFSYEALNGEDITILKS